MFGYGEKSCFQSFQSMMSLVESWLWWVHWCLNYNNNYIIFIHFPFFFFFFFFRIKQERILDFIASLWSLYAYRLKSKRMNNTPKFDKGLRCSFPRISLLRLHWLHCSLSWFSRCWTANKLHRRFFEDRINTTLIEHNHLRINR